MKRAVGLGLLIFGISWLLLSVLTFPITDTVIDTAFILEPGEKYGPRENRIWYYTRGIPFLTGKVSVEGEGIYFAGGGPFADEIKTIFVDSYFNFTIDPVAGDFYAFTFDNTEGEAESHVEFVLEETLTESLTWRLIVRLWRLSPIFWLSSLLGVLLLLPIGFILAFRSSFSKKKG